MLNLIKLTFLFAIFISLPINIRAESILVKTSLDNLINLAIENNTEIKVAQQRSKITEVSKFDAKTNFLPNISANYNEGTRRRTINNLNSKLSEDGKGISLEQPIFNGFSSIAQLKKANYEYDASRKKIADIKNQIAFKVTEQYINIFYLDKIIALKIRNSNLLKEALELANQSLKLQDIDYAKFADISLKKNNSNLERDRDILRSKESKLALRILIGQNLPLINQEPQLENLPSLEELKIIAQNNNPALKEKILNIKARSSEVKVQSGKLLPKISLNLQYDDQNSSQFFGGQSVTNKVISLNFKIPIFQKGTEYAALSRAKKERHLAHLEKKLNLEKITKDLMLSYSKYNSLLENIILLKNSISLSSESFILIKERLKQQDISKLDVLLQESALIAMKVEALNLQIERSKHYFKIKEITDKIS